MTPDQRKPMDDAEDHGILADRGGVDTSSIGILGTQTSQVKVNLPQQPEDSDDDVVDDDHVPEAFRSGEITIDLPGAEAEDDIAEAEIVEDDQLHDADASAGHDDPPGDAAEDVEDVEPETEPGPDPEPEAEPEAEPEPEPEAEPEAAAEPEAEPERHPAAVAEPDPEPAPEPEPEPAPASEPEPEPEPAAPTITRRSASTEPVRADADVVDRHERPSGRAEVALSSKRFGELGTDGARESADLLTPDRLLDPSQISRPEPEGSFRRLVYSLSGRRINMGDNKRARARKALTARIAAPLTGGARFVPILSRKGGVGKTTVTTLMGMALADARDDRVIAVDANPDRGTLAERVGRPSGKTVRDLVRSRDALRGFNDISNIVARDETRLDVLASDSDPRASLAFSDDEYRQVAEVAEHYYSIVLTDTGTGIVHSVMDATLDLAHQIVIVAGLSVDEARLASETLTWLETNGFDEQARGAIVVLNQSGLGAPLVRLDELESHFRTRVRSVIRLPYDPTVATGSAIAFRDLRAETRDAARELAARVVEGLRAHSADR